MKESLIALTSSTVHVQYNILDFAPGDRWMVLKAEPVEFACKWIVASHSKFSMLDGQRHG